MTKGIPLILLFIILFFIFSCQKKEEDASSVTDGSAPVADESVQEEVRGPNPQDLREIRNVETGNDDNVNPNTGRVLNPPPVRDNRQGASGRSNSGRSGSSASAPTSNQTGNQAVNQEDSFSNNQGVLRTDHLFMQRNNYTPVVEDLIIGPLADGQSLKSIAVLPLVSRFFSTFKSGKIDQDVLDPVSKKMINLYLQEQIDAGYIPKIVRFGEPVYTGEDQVRMNFRLLRGKGRAAGEVYLVFKDERWYLADIQADFHNLLEDTEIQLFEPESYRFLNYN